MPCQPIVLVHRMGLSRLSWNHIRIQAADKAMKNCKREKSQIVINNENNINITNNTRKTSSATYKKVCGEQGDVCHDLGFVEEKKGNVTEAKKLYRMACKSGNKESCDAIVRLDN